MLTPLIDAGLDALQLTRERVPALRDTFSAGSAERQALDDVLSAIERAGEVMAKPFCELKGFRR